MWHMLYVCTREEAPCYVMLGASGDFPSAHVGFIPRGPPSDFLNQAREHLRHKKKRADKGRTRLGRRRSHIPPCIQSESNRASRMSVWVGRRSSGLSPSGICKSAMPIFPLSTSAKMMCVLLKMSRSVGRGTAQLW